jgi:hypothetical protein
MKNFQEYFKENVEYINSMGWIDRTLRIVDECYCSCPFYGSYINGMICNHPYWKDKGPFDNRIINHDNSHGKVPNECPLRKGPVTNIKRIRLREVKKIISDADPYGEENWAE